MTQNTPKRKIKDSVFTIYFKIKNIIKVEEIPSFFPKLSLEDAKELEAEVM